ncbi:MAG: hypothetical protein RID07_09760 [Lacipirellulaceae bacterium]|jgi:hypothetical protein
MTVQKDLKVGHPIERIQELLKDGVTDDAGNVRGKSAREVSDKVPATNGRSAQLAVILADLKDIRSLLD